LVNGEYQTVSNPLQKWILSHIIVKLLNFGLTL
jgi:hypothetical protein